MLNIKNKFSYNIDERLYRSFLSKSVDSNIIIDNDIIYSTYVFLHDEIIYQLKNGVADLSYGDLGFIKEDIDKRLNGFIKSYFYIRYKTEKNNINSEILNDVKIPIQYSSDFFIDNVLKDVFDIKVLFQTSNNKKGHVVRLPRNTYDVLYCDFMFFNAKNGSLITLNQDIMFSREEKDVKIFLSDLLKLNYENSFITTTIGNNRYINLYANI